ncbi:ABC transporter ATP-binding protein [Tindallia californiensis]|uniref:Peptide/nickel transport system ATP-binding protein/oligopeptide transport system ATP-binding protein n=1 Tax=Tindallia californiensis TaxID=159292 RepID=A0A1H3QUB4_9FIRM|nr:oligopeptide/dipeptide ABC transporter ATP-binding protein [Tindallia californiensis]SDZ16608.1 peptide/nickel transport system ATP-binding protein/oligopeptide transport system ATP-binding protein [Tindallia californiensis]
MLKNILEVKNLKKYFKTPKGMLHAVDDVSFFIKEGETLGLVGESGCGKSTTGRAILRLVEPTAGEVNFEGRNIVDFNGSQMREARKNMQIIFQDPYASLNPRMNLGQIISEPLLINKVFKDRKKVTDRVKELMDTVGLTPRLLNAFPHELDGGRRQRVGVARALALNPKFIVQDEPVSALDVSIQAQILNLMQDIQEELGLTYLFISHDLSVVKHVSDRIAVMYLGKVVELSEYNAIFKNPLHPYTQALLSAIPVPRVDAPDNMIILEGDVPSPINPPEGCRFYGRCRHRQDICKTKTPELREYEPERFVLCHLVEELQK